MDYSMEFPLPQIAGEEAMEVLAASYASFMDSTTALAEQMQKVAQLIEYNPIQPHPAPEVEHRDDMHPADALWECYDLWASGAWDAHNAECDLREVEQHLARYREVERTRHRSAPGIEVTKGDKRGVVSEQSAESDRYADGYAAAVDDVRGVIDESLNLAHVREALRYLKPITPPGASS